MADHGDGSSRVSCIVSRRGCPILYKTPQSVPFVYREKLIVELELLQEQGIIMLVAEVIDHEWCASIMMTSKKDT